LAHAILRECLLLQLKAFDPQNTLASRLFSEHLKQVQANQLKEVARALNRPIEVVKRALDVIKKLDPRPGCATTRRSRGLSNRMFIFEK